MMKPDESPYLSFRPRRRGRGICFFFSPQKQIPRRSTPSKVARSSFVFSGVIGRDFHAYSWTEGPCNTPRNDRGGLIFDGVEEGAFAT